MNNFLLTICMPSLGKCLFSFPTHFHDLIFLSCFVSVLNIFDANLLSYILCVNICSHSVGYLFIDEGSHTVLRGKRVPFMVIFISSMLHCMSCDFMSLWEQLCKCLEASRAVPSNAQRISGARDNIWAECMQIMNFFNPSVIYDPSRLPFYFNYCFFQSAKTFSLMYFHLFIFSYLYIFPNGALSLESLKQWYFSLYFTH